MAKLKNIHPGEILLEEFLKPLEISQNKPANDIVSRQEGLMRLYMACDQ